MYTIGSIADLISGNTTPNKPKVEIKVVEAKPFKTKSPKIEKENPPEEKLKKSPKKIKTETPKKFEKKTPQKSPKKRKSIVENDTNIKQFETDSQKSPKKRKSIVENETNIKQFKTDSQKNPKKRKSFAVNETKNKKFKTKDTPEETSPKKESKNAKSAIKRMKDSKKERLVDAEKDKRTIFVGNVPLSTKKKHLIQYFTKYGKIQSVRFRSAARAELKIPKKTAFITKQFHPNATTVNCYVVYETEECCKNALASNGELFRENHIRVDLITSRDHDQKKAIFVGNIPFEAKDEDLWKVFSSCGKIESVRLVRDGLTGVGKGYGYINFESLDSVELALQLTDVKIKKRELRIKRANTSFNDGKKRNEKGEKKRKVPRKQKEQKEENEGNENSVKEDSDNEVESETSPKKKKSSPAKSFQGAKFTDKKKKKKINKGEMKKKKMSKILSKKV